MPKNNTFRPVRIGSDVEFSHYIAADGRWDGFREPVIYDGAIYIKKKLSSEWELFRMNQKGEWVPV